LGVVEGPGLCDPAEKSTNPPKIPNLRMPAQASESQLKSGRGNLTFQSAASLSGAEIHSARAGSVPTPDRETARLSDANCLPFSSFFPPGRGLRASTAVYDKHSSTCLRFCAPIIRTNSKDFCKIMDGDKDTHQTGHPLHAERALLAF
jgi:hypothetical protein